MRPDAAGEIGAGGVGGATCEASKYRVTVRVTFDDESTVEMSEQLKRTKSADFTLATSFQSGMTRPTTPRPRSTNRRCPVRTAGAMGVLLDRGMP